VTDEIIINPNKGGLLEFKFPGVTFGVAEYLKAQTGCTVIRFEKPAMTAIDKRGGAVGFIGDYYESDALCLAGGSLYGLESVSGVAEAIYEGRNYSTGFNDIACVTGGIIYDFGRRSSTVYPDKVLGLSAARNTLPNRFLLGAVGAGVSASVGSGFEFNRAEQGGQGAAYRNINNAYFLSIVVLNSFGAIHERNNQVIKGNRNSENGVRESFLEDLESRIVDGRPTTQSLGNTTLSAFITNVKLDYFSLSQIGKQIHSSMSRAIQPFHTVTDGDVCWAFSTGDIEMSQLNSTAIGLIGSELMWDATVSAVKET